MEIYIPYIVGTSVSAFLGNKVYSYFTYENNKEDIQNNKEDIQNNKDLEIYKNDYEIINKKGENERYWEPLGFDFKDKSKSIKLICKNECGFEINEKTRNKERCKILYYISQYEILGHIEFINKYIKKWKLNNINKI